MLKNLILALVFGLLAVTAVGAQTFVFTAIPDEDESRLRQRFDKVAAYLSTEIGVAVEYVPVKSYAAAITAFRNDQVQLAWFGGLSGDCNSSAVPPPLGRDCSTVTNPSGGSFGGFSSANNFFSGENAKSRISPFVKGIFGPGSP